MAKSQNQKKGSSRKCGRNKKPKNAAESLYAKGKISFEKYKKMRGA